MNPSDHDMAPVSSAKAAVAKALVRSQGRVDLGADILRVLTAEDVTPDELVRRIRAIEAEFESRGQFCHHQSRCSRLHLCH